jgi:hypothetical protein
MPIGTAMNHLRGELDNCGQERCAIFGGGATGLGIMAICLEMTRTSLIMYAQ